MVTSRTPRRATAQRIYQLRVQLEYLESAVWRRLWVPDTLTLDRLDGVIQTAMGWRNMHLHAFTIGDIYYAPPDPNGLQSVETRDERRWTLDAALGSGTRQFFYTYDFGDDWRHRIEVEEVMEPNARNRQTLCVAGANACPPEDVGGPPGCMEFLQAIADPLGMVFKTPVAAATETRYSR